MLWLSVAIFGLWVCCMVFVLFLVICPVFVAIVLFYMVIFALWSFSVSFW